MATPLFTFSKKFLAKNFTPFPPSDSIFGRSYPALKGGSNYGRLRDASEMHPCQLGRLLRISINLPFSHAWNTVVIWAGTPSSYLELLDKLQNQMCMTVGPSLAASLEPLAHCQNVASLRYYFGRCSSELTQLVPLPYSWGRSSCY